MIPIRWPDIRKEPYIQIPIGAYSPRVKKILPATHQTIREWYVIGGFDLAPVELKGKARVKVLK